MEPPCWRALVKHLWKEDITRKLYENVCIIRPFITPSRCAITFTAITNDTTKKKINALKMRDSSLNTDRIRKILAGRDYSKKCCVRPHVLHSIGKGCSGPLKQQVPKTFSWSKQFCIKRNEFFSRLRTNKLNALLNSQIKQAAKNCN